MYHEGTILLQDVKGSSLSGVGSEEKASSSSNSAELAMENITTGSKPIRPVINLPQDVQGNHDGANSPDKAMLTTVGSSSMVGSNPSSNTFQLVGEKSKSGLKQTSSMVVHDSENNIETDPPNPLGGHLNENNNGGSNLASLGEGSDAFIGLEGWMDNIAGDSDGVVPNSELIRSLLDGGVQDLVKDAITPVFIGSNSDGGINGNKGKGVVKEVEHHIKTERERRKKMKTMYNTLRSLLPRLPDKADNASIVEEAINCIKTRERIVQRLEMLKKERLRVQQLGAGSSAAPSLLMHHGMPTTSTRESTVADMVQNRNAQQAMLRSSAGPPLRPIQSWCSPNIVLNITGNDGFIIVCKPRQRGLLTKVLGVLEKYCIDVVTTNISSDQNRSILNIHARINAASANFLGNMTAEDRYKLAVSEMLQWPAE